MKLKRLLPGLVILILLLSGCRDPQLSELQRGDVVLAFGDSLTVGFGVGQSQSYPSVLASLTGLKVINAGVSGELSAQGVKRLPPLLAQYQPKLLILFEGGNDILHKVPSEITQANLASMIEIALKQGVAVLLIGAPERKLFGATAQFYATLAQVYQVPLEEDIVANLMTRPSMKSDFIHFNALGYRALAEAVYDKLQTVGAIAATAEKGDGAL